MGACPNCRKELNAAKDIIFVGHDFDLESLLDAKGDEKKEEPVIEEIPVTPEKTDATSQIKNPKLKALFKIINGETPDNQKPGTLDLSMLLRGYEDIPFNGQNRKVLVFANYDETLELVEKFLKEYNFPYLRLGGNFRQSAEIVEQFRTTGKVLLINSSIQCSGLNLQFCTDIVFFHKLVNCHVEQQVCGRGQRVGRTCNLKIHFLMYENEKSI
jgi:SNF2 family DNA or RNA helicase